MINFFNLVYTVIVLYYVILIRNNQVKTNLSLEHIQNEIDNIKICEYQMKLKNNLTIS
jgi:hypothetical protein